MKIKKSPGPTVLTSDMIKFAGDCGLAGLFEVPKEVWGSGIIPSDWSQNETITFYKGKGDPFDASDYCNTQIFEKDLEKRLRQLIKKNR